MTNTEERKGAHIECMLLAKIIIVSSEICLCLLPSHFYLFIYLRLMALIHKVNVMYGNSLKRIPVKIILLADMAEVGLMWYIPLFLRLIPP